MTQRYDSYIWWAFFILIAFVVVAGFIVPQFRDEEGEEVVNEDSQTTIYINQTYGVTFEYPDTYVLVPNTNAEGEDLLSSVSFFEKDEYEAFIDAMGSREGPPGMTFEIYETGEPASAEAWLLARDYFGIPERNELNSQVIAGEEAVRFAWDGLYGGETVVLVRDENVYVWSYTYIEREAAQKIFDELIESVEFQ